jgi:hypothetical protein
MTVALAQAHVTMWWIAIGMGFVVVLVVIVLLSLLIGFVTDIDRNVKSLWNMATRVARNTATTWMLQQTATATAALRDETARHAQALTALAGPTNQTVPASSPAPATSSATNAFQGRPRPRKKLI